MKSKEEILKKIAEITPEFEQAEEAYFSSIKDKQSGENIYMSDFIKLESEYEIIKKEIETLYWVIDSEEN